MVNVLTIRDNPAPSPTSATIATTATTATIATTARLKLFRFPIDHRLSFLERNRQHIADVLSVRHIHVRVHSVNQFRVVNLSVSAKNLVPEAEDVAKIGVGIRHPVVVVNPVHIWCDKDQAQGLIDPLWNHNVGVVELGKDDAEALVKKYQPDGSANDKYGRNGENKADYAFSWVVAVGRSRVNMLVGVVNQVEAPENRDAVLGPVSSVGADEVENRKAEDQHGPKGKRYDLEQTKIIGNDPITGPYKHKSHHEVDQNGCCGKEQIDPGVLPLSVIVGEKGHGTFYEPKERNSSN
jgi:hypothetical protein